MADFVVEANVVSVVGVAARTALADVTHVAQPAFDLAGAVVRETCRTA